MIFIRSHALLNDANQLAVIGVGRGATTLLHATAGCLPSLSSYSADTPTSTAVDSAAGLLDRLRQAAAQDTAPASSAPVAWSGALLRTLCFIRKLQTSAEASNVPALQSRILCLSASPDDPGQYLAVMNSIFAAQRAHVTIDACVLGDTNSPFMQQASFLTGGTYLRPSKPGALAQYLLVSF
jgi:transcription initiation factor TFIIH subunit 3